MHQTTHPTVCTRVPNCRSLCGDVEDFAALVPTLVSKVEDPIDRWTARVSRTESAPWRPSLGPRMNS